MSVTMQSLHQEIEDLRKDVDMLKDILSENVELSDEAKSALKHARETPESEYKDL